ncbi:MAG: M23 family metallopeptidase [Nanoarchaeota archaeon]
MDDLVQRTYYGVLKKSYELADLTLELYSPGFQTGQLIVAEIKPKSPEITFASATLTSKKTATTFPIAPSSSQYKVLMATDIEDKKGEYCLKIIYTKGSEILTETIPIQIERNRFKRQTPLFIPIPETVPYGPYQSLIPETPGDKACFTHIPTAGNADLSFKLPHHGELTGYFGDLRQYQGGDGNLHTRRHDGLDINGNKGDPVLAAIDGIVAYAGWYNGRSGNSVIVNNGTGLYTSYTHLSGFGVKPGQEIKQEEVIGFLGNSGKPLNPHQKYRPHLHFGAKIIGMTTEGKPKECTIDPISLTVLEYLHEKEKDSNAAPDHGRK